MVGKEDIVQKETEPMEEGSNRPNSIKHQKKDDALSSKSSGGVFGSEKGTISGSPK
jgi:hypothetical protein